MPSKPQPTERMVIKKCRLPRPKLSQLEETLDLQLRVSSLPMPVAREYRFSITGHKFDFAWPKCRVAIECEGGSWNQGRHTRGKGFEKDCEKYNLAVLLGWQVGRFTMRMIERGDAIDWAKKALGKGL